MPTSTLNQYFRIFTASKTFLIVIIFSTVQLFQYKIMLFRRPSKYTNILVHFH